MVDIRHEFTIAATPEAVYAAFSDPDQLNQWWTKICQGQPIIGSIYQLYFSEEYDWRARVTIANPGHQFEWTMEDSDEDWEGTKVGIHISPFEDKVLVSFYHTGWPEDNHHYRRSNFCWAYLLHNMKLLLERQTMVPFEERNPF